MSSIVFTGNSFRHGTNAFLSRLSTLNFRTSRAASLNSAINRGLRRSKGVGFKGREKYQERGLDTSAEKSHGGNGLVRRTADPPLSSFPAQMTHDAWRKENVVRRDNNVVKLSPICPPLRLRRGKKDIGEAWSPPKRRSRAARFNDPNYSFGKRSMKRRGLAISAAGVQYRERGLPVEKARPGGDSKVTRGHSKPQISSAAWRATDPDGTSSVMRNPGDLKPSKGRLTYFARIASSPQQETPEELGGRPDDAPTQENDGQPCNDKDAGFRSASVELRPLFRETRFARDGSVVHSTSVRALHNRLPLSIPYTTPASEFLYGTSVIEAALGSRRSPCRKLYKLYVYTGENRENTERDAVFERLAKKRGVNVVHVDSSGSRLLDKMSGGRPHNGYILEASPLPRLPITSLGEFTAQDGNPGFAVSLGHQSREEAAINGTCNFVPVSRDARGRKPFVLFLDSILDPGNLGGIIRTASFLGVTAIAISSRNSASFTPVVLKASAGASEHITLFTVNKPAAFIVDSKLAGWKAYAAVAHPAKRGSGPGAVPWITADHLDNPLERDPCILLLGSEGGGLRSTLRSKADVELAIPASGHSARVDSLNVSVAAGILCHAFLRGARGIPAAAALTSGKKSGIASKSPMPERDLF